MLYMAKKMFMIYLSKLAKLLCACVYASGAYLGGPRACPPLSGGENFFELILMWHIFMLKFEYFWKCTPQMYPLSDNYQIYKFATGLDAGVVS